MKIPNSFQKLLRGAVENRLPISLGLSAAGGIMLRSLFPVQIADPMLQMIVIERPMIFHGFVWSYTPFLLVSILWTADF